MKPGLGLESDSSPVFWDSDLRPVDLALDLLPMDLDLTISESEDLDLDSDLENEDSDLDLPLWDLTTSLTQLVVY